MQDKIKKVKLKGNESFNFREGWLRKGMRCIEQYPTLFSRNDVMEQLGVGSKMVKSIKYWLLATSLCEEVYVNSGRGRALQLTENIGKPIAEYDPYFDDAFTLFLLHYRIVSNQTYCMVWNIFFNEFSGTDFTREDMISVCEEALQKKLEGGAKYSRSLFADDCSSVVRMYQPSADSDDPEEQLQCPLTSLGLLAKSGKTKNAFVKTAPTKDLLDKLMVLYVMADNMPEGRNSIGINELIYSPNNIGKVFNLSRTRINDYLDQLRAAGYITVNRTAGLDMVYLKKSCETTAILEEYYKNAHVR